MNTRSRAGGQFFVSNDSPEPPNNGAILTLAQIIKEVMYSEAEAGLGSLYINFKESIPAWHTIEEMGDKQPYIPMQNDNTTELGIVKNNVTEKMKAMDKKFHWLWFQNNQVQFLDFWAPGTKIGGIVWKNTMKWSITEQSDQNF